jgi:ubiquitin-protein ligase E3 D
MSILIYAELLSNIRQVSVGCSLPSPCSASTKATVSPDGQSLSLHHEGQQKSVALPGRVAISAGLSIQGQGRKTLSWRLPLAVSPTSLVRPSSDLQSVPWSSQGLATAAGVRCRKCDAAIIPEGTVKVWKDLPSENWAEMMEFWHCHKPHDHNHTDDQNLVSRGYGANSRISAQSGVGFVDLTSFLFLETDCTNVTVSLLCRLYSYVSTLRSWV